MQDVVLDGPAPEPTPIALSSDPVIAVRWSADASWLACSVAPGRRRTHAGVGGPPRRQRTPGWSAERASSTPYSGPWTRSGHRIVVTVPSNTAGQPTHAYLVEPATGARERLAVGELINVMDLSIEERLVILRDGRRGRGVLRRAGPRGRPRPSADAALRHRCDGRGACCDPPPADDAAPMVAYLVTEVGLPRRQLVRMPLGPDGWRGEPTVLAAREDAELEELDADDAGHLLLLLWNIGGRSELELLDTRSGARSVIAGMPGLVASSAVLSRNGDSVVVSVEGPERPRELWHVDTLSHRWTRVTQAPDPIGPALVTPTLETFGPRTVSSFLDGCTGRVATRPARRCCTCTVVRRTRSVPGSAPSTRHSRPPASRSSHPTSAARPATVGRSSTPTTGTDGSLPSGMWRRRRASWWSRASQTRGGSG